MKASPQLWQYLAFLLVPFPVADRPPALAGAGEGARMDPGVLDRPARTAPPPATAPTEAAEEDEEEEGESDVEEEGACEVLDEDAECREPVPQERELFDDMESDLTNLIEHEEEAEEGLREAALIIFFASAGTGGEMGLALDAEATGRDADTGRALGAEVAEVAGRAADTGRGPGLDGVPTLPGLARTFTGRSGTAPDGVETSFALLLAPLRAVAAVARWTSPSLSTEAARELDLAVAAGGGAGADEEDVDGFPVSIPRDPRA